MSRFRFIFWIFSTIVIFVSIVVLLVYQTYFQIVFIVEIAVVSINFYLKNREKSKLLEISSIYINECDPERYLVELEKFNKKRIRSKEAKIMDKISKSLVYLDMGREGECYNLLTSLVDSEPNFNTFMRFWFYKAWIYYYDEVDNLSRMQFLIEKTQQLINISPSKYRPQLDANFRHILSRYYVKAGIFLDNAEANYSEIFRGRFPKLTVVISVYHLGIIAYKQRNYDKAIERLSSVVRNANKLYVKEKAIKLLEIIKSKTNA